MTVTIEQPYLIYIYQALVCIVTFFVGYYLGKWQAKREAHLTWEGVRVRQIDTAKDLAAIKLAAENLKDFPDPPTPPDPRIAKWC